MLRFHDAHTSRYAADLMWTRYEPITCATLWTVLWFAVSRLNSNIGNSLALPFAIVFVTGGERMRACVQMDTRIRSIALRFPDKLIPNISESLSIYDSSPIRKRSTFVQPRKISSVDEDAFRLLGVGIERRWFARAKEDRIINIKYIYIELQIDHNSISTGWKFKAKSFFIRFSISLSRN